MKKYLLQDNEVYLRKEKHKDRYTFLYTNYKEFSELLDLIEEYGHNTQYFNAIFIEENND